MSGRKLQTSHDVEILKSLAETLDIDQVLQDHPEWSRDDLRQALDRGADQIAPIDSVAKGVENVTEDGRLPNSVILFADGASRGNPGPSGAGVVFCDERGGPLAEAYSYLGETTNNVAEYKALLLGLETARKDGVRHVRFHCDSELLARQLQGRYKVRSPNLKGLYQKAQQLISQLDSFQVEHVYRDKNSKADELANRAIDDVNKQEFSKT